MGSGSRSGSESCCRSRCWRRAADRREPSEGARRAARVAASSALRAQVDALESSVRDLAGLFEASHNVEPDEFQAFVRPMLPRSNANALVFLRDITEAERPAFEREQGAPIRELAPDGSVRVAGHRSRYIVVVRAAFASRGIDLIGIDALSQQGRRNTIERAERAGMPTATGSVALARTASAGRSSSRRSPPATASGDSSPAPTAIACCSMRSATPSRATSASASRGASVVARSATSRGRRARAPLLRGAGVRRVGRGRAGGRPAVRAARARDRPAAHDAGADPPERAALAASPGDPRCPPDGSVRGVTGRPGPGVPRRALRAGESRAVRDHRPRPRRSPAGARRSSSSTRRTATARRSWSNAR